MGAGSMYTVEAKEVVINSIQSIKLDRILEAYTNNDTVNFEAAFDTQIECTIDGILFSNYNYSGEVEEIVPGIMTKVVLSFENVDIKSESQSDIAEWVERNIHTIRDELVNDHVTTIRYIGRGYSHTPFDGYITRANLDENDERTVHDYYYANSNAMCIVATEIMIHPEKANVAEYIDKVLKGEDTEILYYVDDEEFADKEGAILFAKDRDIDEVKAYVYREDINGDTDVVDVETVWRASEDDGDLYDDYFDESLSEDAKDAEESPRKAIDNIKGAIKSNKYYVGCAKFTPNSFYNYLKEQNGRLKIYKNSDGEYFVSNHRYSSGIVIEPSLIDIIIKDYRFKEFIVGEAPNTLSDEVKDIIHDSCEYALELGYSDGDIVRYCYEDLNLDNIDYDKEVVSKYIHKILTDIKKTSATDESLNEGIADMARAAVDGFKNTVARKVSKNVDVAMGIVDRVRKGETKFQKGAKAWTDGLDKIGDKLMGKAFKAAGMEDANKIYDASAQVSGEPRKQFRVKPGAFKTWKTADEYRASKVKNKPGTDTDGESTSTDKTAAAGGAKTTNTSTNTNTNTNTNSNTNTNTNSNTNNSNNNGGNNTGSQTNTNTGGTAKTYTYFTADDTPETAKQKYRQHAKTLHPDMPGGDKEKFQAMSNEFEHLFDSYDLRRFREGVEKAIKRKVMRMNESKSNINEATTDEFKEIMSLAKQAGFKTAGELFKFKQEHKGKDLIQALRDRVGSNKQEAEAFKVNYKSGNIYASKIIKADSKEAAKKIAEANGIKNIIDVKSMDYGAAERLGFDYIAESLNEDTGEQIYLIHVGSYDWKGQSTESAKTEEEAIDILNKLLKADDSIFNFYIETGASIDAIDNGEYEAIVIGEYTSNDDETSSRYNGCWKIGGSDYTISNDIVTKKTTTKVKQLKEYAESDNPDIFEDIIDRINLATTPVELLDLEDEIDSLDEDDLTEEGFGFLYDALEAKRDEIVVFDNDSLDEYGADFGLTYMFYKDRDGDVMLYYPDIEDYADEDEYDEMMDNFDDFIQFLVDKGADIEDFNEYALVLHRW